MGGDSSARDEAVSTAGGGLQTRPALGFVLVEAVAVGHLRQERK